jgi:class 3 adenylate cyclase/tetratricopeptide (TPR) repeat protein
MCSVDISIDDIPPPEMSTLPPRQRRTHAAASPDVPGDRSAPGLAFLPVDRRLALARGDPLPARARGSVLFADVSGFTATTERLVAALGARRGAEALTQLLDAVHAALIAEVHARRGSVISFAGDAITCFFADDDGRRAVACGLALHRALAAVRRVDPLRGWRLALALKVAVAAGELQRIVAGDPAIQTLDLLVGPAIREAAAIERLLGPGESAVSQPVAAALWPALVVGERRGDELDAPSIVLRLDLEDALDPWPPTPPLDPALVHPWLLRHVRAHMSLGAGTFLGELRLCTVAFVRLPGPGDDAAGLAARVRRAQATVDRHGGVLAQVVLGDKGGYFYAVFGAPVAHEDDAARAVAAAWALVGEPGEAAPAVGISQGRTYAGAYGSPERRTYGILGPEVNTAARLMAAAPPGEILVSERVAAAAPGFRCEPAGALALRGLARPLPALRVVGRAALRRELPRRPRLVGRAPERARLAEALDALVAGRSGVVVLEGEPGTGKSSLVAELVDRAEAAGVTTLVGFADAIEAATLFHAWRAPLAALLGVGPDGAPSPALLAARADPALGPLLPLLSLIVPVRLGDTPETTRLLAEGRANGARAVVAALLARELAGRPLLVVLEDTQWLDSASWALALLLRFELAPLLLVLATRPVAEPWPRPLRQLVDDPTCLHLRPGALAPDEVAALVAAALGVDRVPDEAAAWIAGRGGGHPFFSEELALALRDAGALAVEGRRCRLVGGPAALEGLAHSTHLRGVIAGRVDLLAPAEQLTLKVASVVGPVFGDRILRGVYPIDADARAIDAHLAAFAALALTRREPPPPEPRHAFRHAVTHEVVYDLLLDAQRARLHRAVATWLEGQAQPAGALLAHHWERAGEPARARGYLRAAGARAFAVGAYQEAIAALTRARALEPDDVPADELAADRVLLGDALTRVGRLAEAHAALLAGLDLLGAPYPATPRALAAEVARLAAGQLARRAARWGEPAPAAAWAADPRDAAAARAHVALGRIAYTRNHRLAVVHAGLTRLDLSERTGDPGERAHAYAMLTVIAGAARLGPLAGEYARLARASLEWAGPAAAPGARQILAIAALGDGRVAEAEAMFVRAQGESEAAGDLRVWEEVTAGRGHCLRHRGAWAEADEVFAALLQRALRQGDAQAQGWALANRAYVAMRRGDFAGARDCIARGAAVRGREPDAIGEAKRLCAAVFTGLRDGDAAAADAAAAELVPLIRAAPIAYNMLHAHLGAAEHALAGLGPAPDARAAVDRLARYAAVFPIGEAHAQLVRARWLAATRAVDRSPVDRALTRALAAARRVGLPHCEAEAHLLRAVLLAPPLAERRAHLAAARAGFARLGATWDLARVDALA